MCYTHTQLVTIYQNRLCQTGAGRRWRLIKRSGSSFVRQWTLSGRAVWCQALSSSTPHLENKVTLQLQESALPTALLHLHSSEESVKLSVWDCWSLQLIFTVYRGRITMMWDSWITRRFRFLSILQKVSKSTWWISMKWKRQQQINFPPKLQYFRTRNSEGLSYNLVAPLSFMNTKDKPTTTAGWIAINVHWLLSFHHFIQYNNL